MYTIYDIALSMEFLTSYDRRKLFNHFGNSEAIYSEPLLKIQRILGKRRTLHPDFVEEAKKINDFINRSGIEVLRFDDINFPTQLSDIEDCPFMIFLRGNKNLLSYKKAAIVGTRKPSDIGEQVTCTMVQTLKPYNYAIISGLAKGIDSIAHQSALDFEIPTIGILGCGIDMIYPKESRELAVKMIETGNLLLSEYPPGSRPHKWHFPERNRLIAALSSIVLLAEAPTVHSGTIITAHKAIEYGKTLGIYLPAEDKKECFCGNITFVNDEAGFPLRNRNDLKMMLENNEL
ncbi:MAG: DNA-processing protein DprA [Spirochaetales bacterium]|nr:DNA-processing protein DprA [Spirochaetales bacterium]